MNSNKKKEEKTKSLDDFSDHIIEGKLIKGGFGIFAKFKPFDENDSEDQDTV